MTTVVAWFILAAWVQLAIAHSVIVVLLGRPWRRQDKLVAWVLTGLAVSGALENGNLVVAALILHHLQLGVTLVAYLLSAGVVDALLVVLIRSRRAQRRKELA